MLGFYAEYGVNTYKNTPIYSQRLLFWCQVLGVNTYKNTPIYSQRDSHEKSKCTCVSIYKNKNYDYNKKNSSVRL